MSVKCNAHFGGLGRRHSVVGIDLDEVSGRSGPHPDGFIETAVEPDAFLHTKPRRGNRAAIGRGRLLCAGSAVDDESEKERAEIPCNIRRRHA